MPKLSELFGIKPIIGMIHLQNGTKQALKELDILEAEDVDGAIIENYHGTYHDVVEALQHIELHKRHITMGINILPNEFEDAFPLAQDYGARFIQLDYVAGTYLEGELDFEKYSQFRKLFKDILVLGGVHPKYYTPAPQSNLEKDLQAGKECADAIVVTGEKTGKEVPIEKVQYFRQSLKEHPLIIGAGLNTRNAYTQLLKQAI